MIISRLRKIPNKSVLVVLAIILLSAASTYYITDVRAYKRGLWDGVKQTVEGCYFHREEGAAVLNGDTGHAMLCQGVDTGVVTPGAGITVLTPPRDIPDVVVPESSEEIQRKLKDPKES